MTTEKSSTTKDDEQLLLNHLTKLGTEYEDLSKKEKDLETLLERLKHEERHLKASLSIVDQSSTNRKPSNIQEQQALKRLEDALMEDSSSSSDEEISG